MKDYKFTFLDVCAGIGGFHLALSSKGGKCVGAIENDHQCCAVYTENFGMNPEGDLTKIDLTKLPKHDLLCAGFPCQPFSIAGYRQGFNDAKGRGNIFFYILDILKNQIAKKHPTKVVLLENVKNLMFHDNGHTWKVIHDELEKLGYNVVQHPILASPTDYGIPQNRPRVFIIAVWKKLYDKPLPTSINTPKVPLAPIENYLDKTVDKKYDIDEKLNGCLELLDQFIKAAVPIPTFTIRPLTWLPDYVLPPDSKPYKSKEVQEGLDWYNHHKEQVYGWLKNEFAPTHMEYPNHWLNWKIRKGITGIANTVIERRISGLVVMHPKFIPCLTKSDSGMYYMPYHRKLTPREFARLQSFPDSFKLPESDHVAYAQFGNAVNVEVVKNIFDLIPKKILTK